jgi:hypothetical protein
MTPALTNLERQQAATERINATWQAVQSVDRDDYKGQAAAMDAYLAAIEEARKAYSRMDWGI